MARKPRDYRAEYARRIERAKERARREGREFSRHAARGHKSPEYERNQRVRYRASKVSRTVDLDELIRLTQCDVPPEEWAEDTAFARRYMGEAWLRARLTQKLADINGYRRDPGSVEHGKRWITDMAHRTFVETPDGDQFLPESLWYYHAADKAGS